MLYAFGFERVGVLVGDLYFLDPQPAKGQEGAEHGGHYLIDIIAGTAIAVLAIVAARRAGRVIAKWQVRGAGGALVPAAVPAE